MIKTVAAIADFKAPMRWDWRIQGPNRCEANVFPPNSQPFTIRLDRRPLDLISDMLPGYNAPWIWELSIPSEFNNLIASFMGSGYQEDRDALTGTIIDILRNLYASGNRTGVFMYASSPAELVSVSVVSLYDFAKEKGWETKQVHVESVPGSPSSEYGGSVMITYPGG